MEEKFQIIIGSPPAYNELVAYILIAGKHFALVSQDDGIDKLKIEFFPESGITEISVALLFNAIQAAKLELQ
jgi:hypothetical protein